MIGLIVRRLLFTIPLLFVVSFLVFGMVVLIPGDIAVTLAGGIDATPAAVEAIRKELGLNDPFLVQYAKWLGGVVQFDFGNSLVSHRPVADEIASRIPITLSLALAVFAISIPMSLILGIVGGLRPGGIIDRILMFITSLMIAMPSFWFALVLVTIFAVNFRWLPPFGFTRITDDPVLWLKAVIMPAVALSLAGIATLSRQLRAGLADTMQSAFIRTAWAKGGSTRQVVVGHALKNSAIPAVTVLGLQVGHILGGSVIIEQIFGIPGIGTYMLQAVSDQDVPVIQCVAMLFVVANLLANLGVDIVYGYLNPKVRAS